MLLLLIRYSKKQFYVQIKAKRKILPVSTVMPVYILQSVSLSNLYIPYPIGNVLNFMKQVLRPVRAGVRGMYCRTV